MTASFVDTAIIGAGPYGLSLAAHLQRAGVEFRIFGSPMRFWSHHMPRGMCLKSEGFASNLYDPDGDFTLERYCAQRGIAYAPIGLPVRLETFIGYGIEFQRRYVPQLEDRQIESVSPVADGFELLTATGEMIRTRRAVIATGITQFAHLPPQVEGLSEALVSHSSQHADLSRFKGQQVAVLGAGASALDLLALLHQAGAHVQLVARRQRLAFHDPPILQRSLWTRMREPRSGLGTGWRSKLCVDLPLLFHAMPEMLRLRATERHLGPAPCWFTRDAVVGQVPIHVGGSLESVEPRSAGVRLLIRMQNGQNLCLEAEHVIAATGYQVALSRLTFFNEASLARIRRVADTPILSSRFEASLPGLYFIGASAANSFGPLMRFAFGASFAARRVTHALLQR
jgi:hypothetical protein